MINKEISFIYKTKFYEGFYTIDKDDYNKSRIDFTVYCDNFKYRYYYSQDRNSYRLTKRELGTSELPILYNDISVKQMKKLIFDNPNIKIK